jgi:hypothetical protein
MPTKGEGEIMDWTIIIALVGVLSGILNSFLTFSMPKWYGALGWLASATLFFQNS